MTAVVSSEQRFQPAFARHETFHPRYGWLKKGYDAACADYDVFGASDATTILGVGKNMVRAIRYWCLAYKVCEEEPRADNPRLRRLRPSPFGRSLLEEWDAYLEDPASLWLLHWNLLKPPCRAPSWWAVIHGRRVGDFTDTELVADLTAFCASREDWDVASSSLVKDARCLLRMYADVTQGRDLPEDSIDSPFAELELITAVPGSARHYALNLYRKPTLPDAIVAHACLDFLVTDERSARTATFAGLASNPGSPGRAFALPPALVVEALERYSAEHPDLLETTHAGGVEQLVVPDDRPAAAQAVLERYYAEAR